MNKTIQIKPSKYECLNPVPGNSLKYAYLNPIPGYSSKYEYTNLIQNRFGLLDGHEQTRVITHEELPEEYPDRSFFWNDKKTTPNSMPVAICRRENGDLQVTTEGLTHMLVIGATGSGKTQLIMMILEYYIREFKKTKGENIPSFCISDPKNELYKQFKPKLEKYFNVLCMNFVDYEKSLHWNPLAKVYMFHQKYMEVESEIEVVVEEGKCKNKFRDEIYENQLALDIAVEEAKKDAWSKMSVEIENVARRMCPTLSQREPTWEDGARDSFKGIIYGMIEDGIPLECFNFNTLLDIFDSFGGKETYDGGYFNDRDHDKSNAFKFAHRFVLNDAKTTRDGYMGTLSGMLNIIRDSAIRTITSDCTFDSSVFDEGRKPTVVFLTYPDETKTYGGIIGLFLSSLYTELTKMVRKNGDEPRKNPFIFLLDEFGNLPEFPDFSTNISAARARNIWFWIVLQSYAQLNSVYGQNQAKIIKDNLNQKIFLGTNDRETAEEFSEECGKYTRIAPSYILVGDDNHAQIQIETIPVVTVSRLSQLKIGECIIKRMNAPVIMSRFERHYTCPEFETKKIEVPKSVKIGHISAVPKPIFEISNSSVKKDCVRELEKRFTELIKANDRVSVADIQCKLNIPYKVAKELLDCAQKRNWALIDPKTGMYIVNKNNISKGLLFMPKKVAEAILDEFNEGQIKILEYISDHYCACIDELHGAIGRMDDDVNLKQTLSFFQSVRLISSIDDIFVSNIANDCMELFKMLYPDVKRKRRFSFDF